MASDEGHGTSISFASFTADLLSIDGWNLSRESIETTHMGTTGQKTFQPADLSDPGEISITFAFDPSLTPPIDAPASTCTITWPDATTWAATAFMTSYSPGAATEERMEASATLKVSGAITIA